MGASMLCAPSSPCNSTKSTYFLVKNAEMPVTFCGPYLANESRMDRKPWNPDWSTAIEKVTSLVESLFACRVKFQTVETFLDLAKNSTRGAGPRFHSQDLVFLESTLFEAPALIRGSRPGLFAFPLRVRRAGAATHDVSLVGVATIEGLAASDDERLQMLGEFLHMAVESRINAFERLLDIEQRERALLAQAEVRESSKVVRLFPRKTDEPLESSESFQLRSYENELQLADPILIIGRTASGKTAKPLPYNRIALEIFNRTSLWFFVNISDLSEDAFQSAQSFRDLGRMCIFIPDLAIVSIEKQLRLAEVFGRPEGGGAVSALTDAPRIISVVHDDPAILVANGTVLPHLLALLISYEVDPTFVNNGSVSARDVQEIVQKIVSPGSVKTKSSNLIPILGRWRQDDGSNPTFH